MSRSRLRHPRRHTVGLSPTPRSKPLALPDGVDAVTDVLFAYDGIRAVEHRASRSRRAAPGRTFQVLVVRGGSARSARPASRSPTPSSEAGSASSNGRPPPGQRRWRTPARRSCATPTRKRSPPSSPPDRPSARSRRGAPAQPTRTTRTTSTPCFDVAGTRQGRGGHCERRSRRMVSLDAQPWRRPCRRGPIRDSRVRQAG